MAVQTTLELARRLRPFLEAELVNRRVYSTSHEPGGYMVPIDAASRDKCEYCGRTNRDNDGECRGCGAPI